MKAHHSDGAENVTQLCVHCTYIIMLYPDVPMVSCNVFVCEFCVAYRYLAKTIICIYFSQCFSAGAEIGSHKSDHKYQLTVNIHKQLVFVLVYYHSEY